MLRKIVSIDESLCDGCGACITDCPEGALKIIDGKARLVRESYCDGLGACVGVCPTGAMTIEEREAEEFDEEAVEKHLESRQDDKQPDTLPCGCPSSQVQILGNVTPCQSANQAKTMSSPASALSHWPFQSRLVPPTAPFFEGKELVVLSTCSPVASPDVHWRYVRGRSLVVACPKLDKTEGYVEKLSQIMANNNIPKVIVVRMEVPCCGGLSMMTQQAHAMSGRSDLVVEEVTIGLDGELRATKQL